MFEAASPTMPGAFSPSEPYGASRRRSVYHPPTPSTAPQTPSALGSSSYFSSQPVSNINMASRQNENQRPLLVNRKRSRQDTITSGSARPQLPEDLDTVMRSRNTSSTFGNDVTMSTHTPSNYFNTDVPPSPMPFVNTQYALKGGLDTPTAARAAYFDGDGHTESEFSDVNYRRTLATGRRTASGRHIGQAEGFERDYHSFARLPSSASLESNGRPRIASPEAPASPGWGRLAVGMVGGVVGTVVGKVWQFCRAGAFSGFTAGGGEGYQIHAKHTKEAELADDYSTTQIEFPDPPPAYTPLSEYQEPVDDSLCMVDYPTPEPAAAQRPAKRRQISYENTQNSDAAIERSWVVVPIPSVPSSPAPAPPVNLSRNPRLTTQAQPARYSLPTASSNSARRPQTSYASPTARLPPTRPQRHPLLHTRGSTSVFTSVSVSAAGASSPGAGAGAAFSSRNGMLPPRPSTATASYASPTAERTSTASYASPRSSVGASAASAYQSRLPRPATPSSRASTPSGTPVRSLIPLPAGRNGRNSVAGNRGMGVGTGTQEMSPAAKEAMRWREAKRREEMEGDVAMKRLNRQLEEMIREGQVALGTRFEVRDSQGEGVGQGRGDEVMGGF